MSQMYKCRPSELYSVNDEVTALCFDRAIYLFGTSIDSDLANAGAGAKSAKQENLKRQRVMAKWLGTPVKFQDPGGAKKTEVADVDSSATTGLVVL